MDMQDRMSKNVDSPFELEKLFRENPESFRRQFSKIYAEHSGSVILKVWNERLFHKEQALPDDRPKPSRWRINEILLIILLSVLGANVLVFGYLIGILYHYSRFLKGNMGLQKIEAWIAGYLPIYVVWSMIATFAFPFVFWFK